MRLYFLTSNTLPFEDILLHKLLVGLPALLFLLAPPRSCHVASGSLLSCDILAMVRYERGWGSRKIALRDMDATALHH